MSTSLQGTLNGGLGPGPLTQQDASLLSQKDAAEAALQQLMAEQAAQAASRTQGAEQAGQQYQQAAQAPMPQLNPMAALIQSLGGNVASIIGETPRYAQNAQADLSAQKDELLAKRAQNLAALKDNYDRQAMAAASAGDLLAEAKLRKSAESVSKAWQAIHDEAAFKQANSLADKNNAASEGVLDRASRERIAAMAARSASGGGGVESMTPEEIEGLSRQVVSGEIEITALPNRKGNDVRTVVLKNINDTGRVILKPKARDTMQVLSAAEGILDELSAMSANINVGDSGTRWVSGSKAAAEGAIQSRPDVAVYNSARKGFLATIARATGERGVLTDRDVMRAQQLIPGIFDSKEVATGKLLMLREFITGMKDRTITNYTQPMAGVLSGLVPEVSKGVAKKDTTPITVRGPKNELRTIEAWEIPEAVKHGWKRAK
jgi:hypothetical protein